MRSVGIRAGPGSERGRVAVDFSVGVHVFGGQVRSGTRAIAHNIQYRKLGAIITSIQKTHAERAHCNHTRKHGQYEIRYSHLLRAQRS